MFFDTPLEKILFIIVASSAVYLSFDRLYVESGAESRTDFDGWKDYITNLVEGNDTLLKAILGIFVFSLIIGLVTLKTLVKPKKNNNY